MMDKHTFSLCPVCLKRIEAEYTKEGDTVYLIKECEEHGRFSTAVWRGSPDMLLWCGNVTEGETNSRCPELCGLCGYHLRDTCCALLNVTSRCNLKCGYCFAGDSRAEDPSMDYIRHCIGDMASRGITHLHLSGGEPTVRDDIPEIAEYAVKSGFKYIQLNTNGMRIAREKSYAKELADSGVSSVFLQFDGTDDKVYEAIRGKPIYSEKIKAIENCDDARLGVVLVPTLIPGVNDSQIGEIIKFGIRHIPAVNGIHFQPVTYVGRYPGLPADSDRITIPEVLLAIENQTEGMIRKEQFSPSCCDHPMCGFHSEFIYENNKLRPLIKSRAKKSCCEDRKTSVRKNQNYVSVRWTRLKSCCSPERPYSIDALLDNLRRNSFSITGMAFQDEYNVDLNRLKHCSLHVYDNGRIMPFCAKYIYHDRVRRKLESE